MPSLNCKAISLLIEEWPMRQLSLLTSVAVNKSQQRHRTLCMLVGCRSSNSLERDDSETRIKKNAECGEEFRMTMMDEDPYLPHTPPATFLFMRSAAIEFSRENFLKISSRIRSVTLYIARR